ncbi:hypothetical protein ACOSQ3_014185 [Xanthoceras sorbifolium]
MDSEEISRIVSELNLSELDCPAAVFKGSIREAVAAPLERSKGRWRPDNKPLRASASKKPDSAPSKSLAKGQPSSGATMASEDMPDIRDSAQADHGTASVSCKGQPSVPDSAPNISAPIIFEDIPETLSMPPIPTSADVCPTPSDSVSSAPDFVKGSLSLVSPKHSRLRSDATPGSKRKLLDDTKSIFLDKKIKFVDCVVEYAPALSAVNKFGYNSGSSYSKLLDRSKGGAFVWSLYGCSMMLLKR